VDASGRERGKKEKKVKERGKTMKKLGPKCKSRVLGGPPEELTHKVTTGAPRTQGGERRKFNSSCEKKRRIGWLVFRKKIEKKKMRKKECRRN